MTGRKKMTNCSFFLYLLCGFDSTWFFFPAVLTLPVLRGGNQRDAGQGLVAHVVHVQAGAVLLVELGCILK